MQAFHETFLVRLNSGNGWLLTGFKLNEHSSQIRGVTTSDQRLNQATHSRFSEVAVQRQLSDLADEYVSEANICQYK